jgi:BlaI family transcriptional regulator, penicillinase repressor
VDDIKTPTTRELEILKVLWERGPSSVRDVHQQMLGRATDDPAYNTVQTLLRLMEGKKLVSHHVEGRTFIYTPLFSRNESAARFVERVFDGAPSQLVLSLLEEERISPDEIEQLYALIATARKRRNKS